VFAGNRERFPEAEESDQERCPASFDDLAYASADRECSAVGMQAQQLQQKYGKVDLAEHQRMQEELVAAHTAQIRAFIEICRQQGRPWQGSLQQC